MTPGELRGTVVVLTGASSGIGRLAARTLAGRGARVVLAARGERTLEEARLECEAVGGEALAVATDVGEWSRSRSWPAAPSSGSDASTCGSTTRP